MPMHAPRPAAPIRLPVRPRERGVAMLLVIVLLFATTILAGAALTSRSNSGQIGVNAVDSTSAEWAAESAARLTEAILESSADWIDTTGGEVLTDFTIAGAAVTVKVTDLDGNAPDDDDRNLLVTITSKVGDIEVVSQKVIAIADDTPSDPADVLDEDLDEFALYGVGGLQVGSGSCVYPWPNSPEYTADKRVKIGLGSDSASALEMSSGYVKDGALYVNSTASSTLSSLIGGASFPEGGVLPLTVPVIAETVPAALTSLADATTSDSVLDTPGAVRSGRGGAYRKMRVRDGCELQLKESAGGDFSFEELRIDSKGILSVHGAVRIYVEGDMEVSSGGAINFGDRTASVTFYVGGGLRVDDAAVGCSTDIAAASGSRGVGSVTWYMNPARMKFVSTATGSGEDWEIDNNALFLGSIRAPQNNVAIGNNSHIIGRVTGNRVALSGSATLAFDKCLDLGAGLTRMDGMLYDAESGVPADGLVNAIAAFKASGSSEKLGAFVRQWLVSNGYADCFAACDEASGTAVTVVEALAPVISIEAHGSSTVSNETRTLTILSVTKAPSESESVDSEAVAETDDGLIESVGKTVESVTESVGSLLTGGK
ncbi:MAG: hypothetical protein KDA21_01860 [Phycisphaerales bacterium]|nr:hypothetical protein [Phycisphaerales bacterium]